MASSGSIDKHNNSLAYAETELDSPAEGQFAVTWAPDGRTVTIWGPCPACGGRTATKYSPGIGGSKGFRGRAPRPPYLLSPVTLYCECGHAHTDRPPDAPDKGCGRFWPVVVPDDVCQPPAPGAAGTTAES
jgi:hypothetical protein